MASLKVMESPWLTRLMAAPPVAVAILDDLLFTAKIRETARIIGVELTVVRDPSVLHQGPPPSILLLDLNSRKVDPFAALEVVRNRPDGGKTARAIAFAASIDKALVQSARDAGVDPILDRGQLTEQLPEILRSVARAPVTMD
jgi:CheY-like chemotaxis protein